MRGDLRGRIALVTGVGRPSGIGVATCRALASDGADIVLTYWRGYDRSAYGDDSTDWPDPLLGELRALGIRAHALEADLSDPGAAILLLDAVERTLGLPHILVNNAAHSTNADFRTLNAADLDAHYAVNVRGAALLSVEFVRRRVAGQITPPSTGGSSPSAQPPSGSALTGGRIVNLTSGQSRGPMPGELAYVASKGAIEAFTVTLAAEVAHLGITVNAVNPGPTDTGWMNESQRAELLARFPTGRLGQPDDAARLIAFLASDAAGWISGQVIHSEGGFRH